MDLAAFFTIVLCTVLLVKWLLKRREILKTFERLGIPGPKPSFFIGNLSEITSKPYYEVDWVEKYGPIFGFFSGIKPILAITDPELLKIIQVKEGRIFHVRNPVIPNVTVPNNLFHRSLVFFVGPHWKENRDSVTPSYTTSKFKMMSDVINGELDKAVAKISEFAKKGQSFDLGEIHSTVFGNAALQVTFGIKMNPDETGAVQILFDSMGRGFTARLRDPENYLSVCLPEIENLFDIFRRVRERVRKVFNLPSVHNVPEMCDIALKARMNDKNTDYVDVAQFMINSITNKKSSSAPKITDYPEKLQMKEGDLVPNSLYLALTTYDLIRTISTYATYELAKSPRVQEKLRKEVIAINGNEKHISYERMSRMQYLDQVFNEAIRLHPTVPFFTNRIAEEDYYYKGQLIPKGMTVYVPQIGMQRSSLFFPDPEAFIPERFDDKSKIDPYIYQPFGIGPRHCLGMRIAQYFGKMALARTVQSFNLSVDPNAREVRPDVGFVVYRPKDPVRLIASPV